MSEPTPIVTASNMKEAVASTKPPKYTTGNGFLAREHGRVTRFEVLGSTGYIRLFFESKKHLDVMRGKLLLQAKAMREGESQGYIEIDPAEIDYRLWLVEEVQKACIKSRENEKLPYLAPTVKAFEVGLKVMEKVQKQHIK